MEETNKITLRHGAYYIVDVGKSRVVWQFWEHPDGPVWYQCGVEMSIPLERVKRIIKKIELWEEPK
jgi:hypothetical protein